MNTDGLKQLWKTVFGDPDDFIDTFFRMAFSPQRCRFIVEDGEIVSALYWFDCEYEGGKLAYIYAVATHPKHRGKGLASRLMKETHVHLKTLGYAGCVLKPAKGLFPFYKRLGYVTSGFVRRFSVSSGIIPIEISELSAVEYGRKRRLFLPENGILQEGITLEFLHSFAFFYASNDAIVCIAKEEPLIFEFLGNPNSAPGILAALGIQTADFQTCGTEIPFAMFCPLNCTKIPGYLGLSLE